VTIDEFRWSEEQAYSWGETDRNGYYELNRPLVRGQAYSLVAGAERYYGIGEDGVYIAENLESPYELSLSLQPLR